MNSLFEPIKTFSGRHRIQPTDTTDKSRPYGSILELIDIDYTFVGEFVCVHSDSIDNGNYDDLRLDFKASRIYVFVDGNVIFIDLLDVIELFGNTQNSNVFFGFIQIRKIHWSMPHYHL